MRNQSIMKLNNIGFSPEEGFFKKRSVEIIQDISFSIERGNIIAIVGESGCGKTTLGKILSGLIKPTSGQILFHDKDICRLNRKSYKEYRPKIQMVLQDSYAALNPRRNIYQILAFPLKHYGTKKGELKESVINLLQYVGITPPEYFMNKFPYHLSGGQRQRVCFARVLISTPELIVADEPVAMIDMSLRLSMLDVILKLNKERDTAFVFITHGLPSVKYLGKTEKSIKVKVMYLGKIIEDCDLDEAFNNPRHPYLQALLMAAPIPDPRLARSLPPPKIKSTEIPSMRNRPGGCYFNPRCIYAEGICSRKEPGLMDISDNHKVACHFKERVPKWDIF